jgi:transposase
MTAGSFCSHSPWSGHDRRRLARALRRCRDVRLSRRLHAVLRVADGEPIAQVARALRLSRRSVHRWVRVYQQSRRPEDLLDQARSGRPREADDLDADLLAELLAQDPRTCGYRATSWTVPLLTTHLREECGCPVSARTLRRRLHEHGWRWKRLRYVYCGREPHVGQKKGAFAGA